MRVFTMLNISNMPQGTRLGFTYSEIDDEGITTKDNIKGSMIVIDKEMQNHIDALKDYIGEWIDQRA